MFKMLMEAAISYIRPQKNKWGFLDLLKTRNILLCIQNAIKLNMFDIFISSVSPFSKHRILFCPDLIHPYNNPGREVLLLPPFYTESEAAGWWLVQVYGGFCGWANVGHTFMLCHWTLDQDLSMKLEQRETSLGNSRCRAISFLIKLPWHCKLCRL